MFWRKFRKLLLSSPPGTCHLRCVARCTMPDSTQLCSTEAKSGDWTTLTCSGPTAMIVPWSPGSVVPKIGTKHPRFHYSKKSALRILLQYFTVNSSGRIDLYNWPCPVSNLSQIYRSPALEGEKDVARRGSDVWKLMSTNVACWALTHKAETHGKMVSDVACSWKPYQTGPWQQPKFKMDMDKWSPLLAEKML